MLAARCQRFYKAGEPTIWLQMPLTYLAFFVAEIEPLKAEESLRRIKEIRIAHAPAGEDGDSAREIEREWGEQASRADREPPRERPKMTKAEYDATLAMVGVNRREWVVEDSG